MRHLALTTEDNALLRPILDELAATHGTIEDAELVRRARLHSRSLPVRLFEFLEEFRIEEPSAVCRVSGLAIDDGGLGATPAHWRDSQHGSPAFAQEIFFLLCASVLGDVFGWATQQDGRIMHDVLPIAGHEHYEIGSNSLQPLSWHTEDAFHPCRGDYVGLMCLRNPGQVETLVCDAADIPWDVLDVAALFEPLFTQMPDNSHRPENASESTGDPVLDRLRARSFAMIQSWTDEPVGRPVLYGDAHTPYMALDPYHMLTDGWPEPSRAAFEDLCAQIEKHMTGLSLQPGDCVFIDNFRAVHGRRSFTARFDGSDRWLKRLNVTRNLRGSRAWRPAPGHRVLY
jgi:Fe(II)/alpha-ketoglutarate-dependent arginine beta-hydroxylase